MHTLTSETLDQIARSLGLTLSAEELAELVPLVNAARAMMDALPAGALRDVEPASQYRIL